MKRSVRNLLTHLAHWLARPTQSLPRSVAVAAAIAAARASGSVRADPAAGVVATATGRPAVVALLEDNADALLPLLTNPTGDPGEGHVEHVNVFSGRSAVRIVPLQRFEPHIPGWKYRIVEKPAAGEY